MTIFLDKSSNWINALEKCHFLTALIYELNDFSYVARLLRYQITLRHDLETKVELFWYLAQSAFLSKKSEAKHYTHQAFEHLIDRGFKYEVQHGLKIHETPDAGF